MHPIHDANNPNWYKCLDCQWSFPRSEIMTFVDDEGKKLQWCNGCMENFSKKITEYKIRKQRNDGFKSC
jgi:hypothetical protein